MGVMRRFIHDLWLFFDIVWRESGLTSILGGVVSPCGSWQLEGHILIPRVLFQIGSNASFSVLFRKNECESHWCQGDQNQKSNYIFLTDHDDTTRYSSPWFGYVNILCLNYRNFELFRNDQLLFLVRQLVGQIMSVWHTKSKRVRRECEFHHHC